MKTHVTLACVKTTGHVLAAFTRHAEPDVPVNGSQWKRQRLLVRLLNRDEIATNPANASDIQVDFPCEYLDFPTILAEEARLTNPRGFVLTGEGPAQSLQDTIRSGDGSLLAPEEIKGQKLKVRMSFSATPTRDLPVLAHVQYPDGFSETVLGRIPTGQKDTSLTLVRQPAPNQTYHVMIFAGLSAPAAGIIKQSTTP